MRKTGTKVWGRTFLPAVRELIRWYGSFKGTDDGTITSYGLNNPSLCPLCVASAEFNTPRTHRDECVYCPWEVLGGMHCSETTWYCEVLIKTRLARLRRWERKLLKIIGE